MDHSQCVLVLSCLGALAVSVWDFELNRRESSNLAMEKPHFHESYEIMVPLTRGSFTFRKRSERAFWISSLIRLIRLDAMICLLCSS